MLYVNSTRGLETGGSSADCRDSLCRDQHVEFHTSRLHSAGPWIPGNPADIHGKNDRWHDEVRSRGLIFAIARPICSQEESGFHQMFVFLYRFMFILMIIGTAFLCGINNIYVPYVVSAHLGRWLITCLHVISRVWLEMNYKCLSLVFLLRFNETFNFLFWTMFGMANQEYVDMHDYALAEFVGRIFYGIFTLLIVIVLLNMLIAMISNSFQRIEVSTYSMKNDFKWFGRKHCSFSTQKFKLHLFIVHVVSNLHSHGKQKTTILTIENIFF